MRKTLVGFVRATCAEGSVTANRAYNCAVSFTADGDYTISLGKGGAAESNMVVEIETELGAGDALGSIPSVVNANSNTSKRVQFRNATNGALREPVGFAASIYRLTPAITGS